MIQRDARLFQLWIPIREYDQRALMTPLVKKERIRVCAAAWKYFQDLAHDFLYGLQVVPGQRKRPDGASTVRPFQVRHETGGSVLVADTDHVLAAGLGVAHRTVSTRVDPLVVPLVGQVEAFQ